jgi:hypothetical protein
MKSKAKASRSTRRKPSPQERVDRLAEQAVIESIDIMEDLGRLFSEVDMSESIESAFLAAARAEYDTKRIGPDDTEGQQVWRFLSGGAVGYRLGLAVARQLAEVGR